MTRKSKNYIIIYYNMKFGKQQLIIQNELAFK